MATYLNPQRYQILSSSKHTGGVQALMADGSVRFLGSALELPSSIKQTYAGGVDLIIIGESPKTGWSPADQFASKGIIAVLIGMLLPAVQAAREAARRRSMHFPNSGSGVLASLEGLLRPGGQIFVIDADGRMLPYIE
jgi:prepilin-type processing-associated H-X9-DG protein